MGLPRGKVQCRKMSEMWKDTQRHSQESSLRSESNAVSVEKIDAGALPKQVKWHGIKNLVGTIDTGSSGCLLRK